MGDRGRSSPCARPGPGGAFRRSSRNGRRRLLRRGRALAANPRQHLLDVEREDVFGGPLTVERDLGTHRSLRPDAAKGGPDRRPGSGHGDMRRRRLIAAMRHAVGALLISAGPVAVPVRRLHELLERRGISLAEEIAWLLPAEDVAGRHAPRRASEVAVAGEEIEEKARVHEAPPPALAHGENVSEQLLRLPAGEEVLLIRRPLVGVARRY